VFSEQFIFRTTVSPQHSSTVRRMFLIQKRRTDVTGQHPQDVVALDSKECFIDCHIPSLRGLFVATRRRRSTGLCERLPTLRGLNLSVSSHEIDPRSKRRSNATERQRPSDGVDRFAVHQARKSNTCQPLVVVASPKRYLELPARSVFLKPIGGAEGVVHVVTLEYV